MITELYFRNLFLLQNRVVFNVKSQQSNGSFFYAHFAYADIEL